MNTIIFHVCQSDYEDTYNTPYDEGSLITPPASISDDTSSEESNEDFYDNDDEAAEIIFPTSDQIAQA